MTVVEFPAADGGPVLVQVTQAVPSDVVTRGIGLSQAVDQVEHSFDDALGTIQAVANGVLRQLGGIGRRPDGYIWSSGWSSRPMPGRLCWSRRAVRPTCWSR